MLLRVASVQKLVRGIHQFRENYFASHAALFRQLATSGQNPETLFITCSDSRVVPNLITSAPPGELFIVRNVGNVVPPYDPDSSGATAAALEYAVEVLRIENIIVCGHTSCGAMDAVLHPERAENLPHVKRWLRHTSTIREVVETRYTDIQGEALMTLTAQENVLEQLNHVRTYPFIAEKLESGRMQMNGWIFDIATGSVFDFNPATVAFEPLVLAPGE